MILNCVLINNQTGSTSSAFSDEDMDNIYHLYAYAFSVFSKSNFEAENQNFLKCFS